MTDIKMTKQRGAKVEAGEIAEKPGIAFNTAEARK